MAVEQKAAPPRAKARECWGIVAPNGRILPHLIRSHPDEATGRAAENAETRSWADLRRCGYRLARLRIEEVEP